MRFPVWVQKLTISKRPHVFRTAFTADIASDQFHNFPLLWDSDGQLSVPTQSDGDGPSMTRKRIAASVLSLQMGLFALGTIYLAWLFQRVMMAGAGFVPGFEAIEQRRLIAALAPYLALPFGAAFSFLLLGTEDTERLHLSHSLSRLVPSSPDSHS
jgi:hypothetical protein